MRFILFVLLGSIAIVYGYILDQSCDNNKQMIIDGLSSVFNLKLAAVNLLSSLSANKDDSRFDGPDLAKFQLRKTFFQKTRWKVRF